jgi:hypothetical protein
MAEIFIENIPAELYFKLEVTAKKSGLTLQQVVIKALEKYVEKIKIDSYISRLIKIYYTFIFSIKI